MDYSRYVAQCSPTATKMQIPDVECLHENRFDLTVNIKTAKKLGVAIPKTIQMQASRMIK